MGVQSCRFSQFAKVSDTLMQSTMFSRSVVNAGCDYDYDCIGIYARH